MNMKCETPDHREKNKICCQIEVELLKANQINNVKFTIEVFKMP